MFRFISPFNPSSIVLWVLNRGSCWNSNFVSLWNDLLLQIQQYYSSFCHWQCSNVFLGNVCFPWIHSLYFVHNPNTIKHISLQILMILMLGIQTYGSVRHEISFNASTTKISTTSCVKYHNINFFINGMWPQTCNN